MGVAIKLTWTFVALCVLSGIVSVTRLSDENKRVEAVSVLLFWIGLVGTVVFALIHVWTR